MALTYTARTGVSIMHGSSLADTLRALRQLEMCNDLDLDIVVGVRAGDPDESALAAGLRGRGDLLPIDSAISASAACNTTIARMVDKGNQYAWIMSPELVIEEWTLGVLTRHMARVPDCAAVSPRIMQDAQPEPRIWSDGGVVSGDSSVKRISAGMKLSKALKPKPADVDAVHRVGSLYRMSAIETVGPFAEDDVVDGHDVGWGDRARRAGWRIMVHRRARPVLEGVHG